MRLVLVCFALGAACAHQPLGRSGPTRGTPLENVPIADVPVHGFPVELKYEGGTASGELMGLDAQHVWVLVSDVGLVGVHRDELKQVSVEVHPSHAVGSGVWGGLATASTLSHGFWLIFTAPLWLVASIVGTATLANGNDHVSNNPSEFKKLEEYARYPQGMPNKLTNCERHPPASSSPSLPPPLPPAL